MSTFMTESSFSVILSSSLVYHYFEHDIDIRKLLLIKQENE